MNNINLTVIVPRLPPSIDGVGDYGLLLAKQLREDEGINTRFIVGDPNWLGPKMIEGFKIDVVEKRSKKALLALLSKNDSIFLHYVGYGFAKRGCPIWLILALKSWRKLSNKKCITMFHECYAFGPIWTSQFWVSPIQRKLVKYLGLISDKCLTSKISYAEIIKKFSNNKHSVTILPVFSNIGEVKNVLPLAEREKTLIVFGSFGWRKKVYKNSFPELNNIIKIMKITKVVDIGEKLNFPIIFENNLPVEILGTISASEVSLIFSKSLVGFFNYPTGYLSKSGIFASYCSHGLLPIGASNRHQISDGVLEGVHFLNAESISQDMGLSDFQQIASNAFSWYESHNLSVHSKKLIKILD